jgi:hypothetical protein
MKLVRDYLGFAVRFCYAAVVGRMARRSTLRTPRAIKPRSEFGLRHGIWHKHLDDRRARR